jgi:magnesium transporter
MHLGEHWILTVHQDADALLDPVADRFSKGTHNGYEEGLYRILDQLADSFFPELEEIDDVIDALMTDMVERPSTDQRQRLFALRRQLVGLRRIVGPQRDLLVRSDVVLERLPGIDRDEARHWLRDVYDHQLRIAEQIDAERDLLSGALDVYLSTVSNRLNQVSKQLTVVATIFLPLTFVTGFFGQNFGWMVRHIGSFGAFLAYGVGGLILSGVALLWWFRRAGFLSD